MKIGPVPTNFRDDEVFVSVRDKELPYRMILVRSCRETLSEYEPC
jgi:hypothetical protein